MTLLEAINEQDSEYLYIGSTGGAYIWIGKRTEAVDAIKRCDEQYRAMLSDRIVRSRKTIEYYFKALVKIDKKKAILQSWLDTGTNKELTTEYADRMKRLRTEEEHGILRRDHHKKRLKFFTEQLENWHSFLDREMHDIYPHTSAPEGMSLIFNGIEHGAYWMIEEMPEGVEG